MLAWLMIFFAIKKNIGKYKGNNVVVFLNEQYIPQNPKPRIERKNDEPRTIPSKYIPKTQQIQNNTNSNQQHTSVRVNQRPGGNSSIVFGNDDSNYEHYRK